MPLAATLLAFALLNPPSGQGVFDETLRSAFGQSGAPGAGVAVFKEGKLVFSRAFGLADESSKRPMRADMPFEIGSLSKQFTATALLMLAKEGKLRLEEKLGDVLPDLPESWRDATVEQTLHHMSGIPDYEEIAGYDFYNAPRRPQEIIDAAATKPLDFPPGSQYRYSNTGYFLLSLVLEKRSGIPAGKFLEERIFKPLGMDQTYAQTLPGKPNLPQGYHSRSGERKPQPPIAWSSTLGAGGIVSTIRDLGKWDAALYTEKLLPSEFRDKLWQTTKTTGGEPVNYGFGWVMSTYRGFARQGHSGQTNGFTCVYDRIPELKTSAIAFSNTYGGGVVFSLRGLALAHFSKELSYLSLPIPADPDPVRNAAHLAVLRQVVGPAEAMSGLTPALKEFALKPEFEKDAREIKAMLAGLKSFRYIRDSTRKNAAGQDVEEFFYRLDYDVRTVFWTLRFIGGKLAGLNWENE